MIAGNDEIMEVAQSTQTKFVRYPLLPTSLENPHRLHPYLDVVQGVIIFTIYLISAECIALMLAPHLPELSFLTLLTVPIGMLLIRLVLRSSRLKLSAHGISFPIAMTRALNGRLQRPWSDLEKVDLHEGLDEGNRIKGNVLTFAFKTGARIDLTITRIPRDDLKSLAEALATFPASDVVSPAVNELVSRFDFESDSTMFVFAKKHRSLLSQNFGLSNTEPLTLGTKLLYGKYTVERLLSSGGYQASYLVVDLNGEQFELHEFDLSVVPESKRQECIQHLLREGDLRKDLELPNLAKQANHYVDGNKFYVAMERGSVNWSGPFGGKAMTLRKAVKPGSSLAPKYVTSLGLQLALTVAEAQSHEPPLVLSAIRPDSIIWSPIGAIVITEPGFVCDIITGHTDILLMDAPYAAPERLASEAVSASDLYSIGATMYFALTGTDPECGSGGQARAVNKKADRSLSDLAARLMSSDVENRGTIAQLIHELGGFLPVTDKQVQQ